MTERSGVQSFKPTHPFKETYSFAYAEIQKNMSMGYYVVNICLQVKKNI
jgi:hypothetical protein